ncbi:hypothetical protein GQ53DRAFT_786227 [Thozetella sp. PMI_491]|nr:hypothetical protein GQ53DRAFT_786227 [Thozetella sp. PMI_491]
MKWEARKGLPGSLLGSEVVKVVVGPQKQEFSVHKKLLCTASPYFRERLEATPAGLALSSPREQQLWLEKENPEMFELFMLWLYRRRAFKTFIDEAIQSVTPHAHFTPYPNLQTDTCRQSLQWNLVRLHLFAALVELPALQDAAMDAIQDMYLRLDWQVTPRLIKFLYAGCEPDQAFRLRKWAVAMVTWQLYGGEAQATDAQFQRLFDTYADFVDDYNIHLIKLIESKANIMVKNPQLRLPENKLRNEERFFGFRQCSFHSHRSTVGEGACPLSQVHSPLRPSPWMRAKEEMESDDSDTDRGILSPVSERRTGVSYLNFI